MTDFTGQIAATIYGLRAGKREPARVIVHPTTWCSLAADMTICSVVRHMQDSVAHITEIAILGVPVVMNDKLDPEECVIETPHKFRFRA